MANAVLVPILLVVALQAGAGAWTWTWPWASGASEACAQPGALRDEAEGGVSVCVAGEGWLRVPTLAGASPRSAPDCTGLAGQYVCDTTCSERGICLTGGSWYSVGFCQDHSLCIDGDCVISSDKECSPTDTITIKCGTKGNYPNLSNCSTYFSCETAGFGDGVSNQCAEGYTFDACTQECSVALPAGEECPWAISDPCSVAGTVGVAPNNDRLYYICVEEAGSTYELWNKCISGHFNLTSLKCDNEAEPGCGAIRPST